MPATDFSAVSVCEICTGTIRQISTYAYDRKISHWYDEVGNFTLKNNSKNRFTRNNDKITFLSKIICYAFEVLHVFYKFIYLLFCLCTSRLIGKYIENVCRRIKPQRRWRDAFILYTFSRYF